MKRLFSIIAILCAMALVISATGCGSSQKPAETTAAPTEAVTEAPAEETTEAPAEETTEAAAEEATEETTEAPAEDTSEAAAQGDLTPSIVIELGDFDGIETLAKDAQNMKIEEGTVARITGLASTGISTNSIMEDNGNGTKKGITLHIDGDFEFPKDDTEMEVTGTFTKGSFSMEFHVLPENIIVK